MLPESQLIECWMQLKDTIYKKMYKYRRKDFSITWYPDTLYNTYTFYMNILYDNSIPWPLSMGYAFMKGRHVCRFCQFCQYPKRNNSCMLYEFVGIDKIWTEIKHCKMWRRPNKSSFQIFEAFTSRKVHLLIFLLKSCCNRHHVVFAR